MATETQDWLVRVRSGSSVFILTSELIWEVESGSQWAEDWVELANSAFGRYKQYDYSPGEGPMGPAWARQFFGKSAEIEVHHYDTPRDPNLLF